MRLKNPRKTLPVDSIHVFGIGFVLRIHFLPHCSLYTWKFFIGKRSENEKVSQHLVSTMYICDLLVAKLEVCNFVPTTYDIQSASCDKWENIEFLFI